MIETRAGELINRLRMINGRADGGADEGERERERETEACSGDCHSRVDGSMASMSHFIQTRNITLSPD